MCNDLTGSINGKFSKIPLHEAIGCVLAHDITEIRVGEFKGAAFLKGHIVREEDIPHLKRLGKEHLFVLTIGDNEMHEDDAAYALATALMGEGVKIKGSPREGKIEIIATYDGLLEVKRDALFDFNMLGEVMCATLHSYSPVKEGEVVAATRAIPLVIKRGIVEEAVCIARRVGGIVAVKKMRKPKAGVVITGNEVYYGRIKDAFAPVITRKIEALGGEVKALSFAPDDETFIREELSKMVKAGVDLLITTGGMSVDPDDVTRNAIRDLGAVDITYGTPVLPGAMFLIAYLEGSPTIPILGIPACGMYAETTVFDLVLPRVLIGERIGRRELAELGYGGLCRRCKVCRYPICSFGK